MVSRVSSDKSLPRRLFREPNLSREEEAELARRWHFDGDMKARKRLVLSHLPFVAKCAHRFKRYYPQLSLDDLFSEGVIALQGVVDRKGERQFDPERGRLTTIAWYHVVRAMQIFAQKDLFNGPDKRTILKKMATEDGEEGHRTREQFGQMPQFISLSGAALSSNDDDTNDAFANFLLRNGEPVDWQTEEDALLTRLDNEKAIDCIRLIVAELSPREQFVIKHRTFIGDSFIKITTALARFENSGEMSKERIRQIETTAIKKIRSKLSKKYGRLWRSRAIPKLLT